MLKWYEHLGLYQSAVNIGVINIDGEYILIDTGIDNSSINKVIKVLDKQPIGALITHHHADHIGGISKLESLGIRDIYAPANEISLIKQTLLEPYTIYGGIPPKKLRNKHLMAKNSTYVKPLEKSIWGKHISTPGHTIDHYCYLFDNTVYLGDAAFTQDTISKYKLLFAVDPSLASNSIDQIMALNFNIAVPAHGPVQESRSDAFTMLKATQQHYKETANLLLQIAGEKIALSILPDKMIASLELKETVASRGITQYYLYKHTLNGYISNLLDAGKLSFDFSSGEVFLIAT